MALCIGAGLAGGAWWLSPASAQQPPPVVVQAPNGSPGASAQPAQTGETFFQTAGEVAFQNGEGAITATLGDLLRTSDAAGLEKVRITGRVRNVTGAGTSIGQVLWTAVSVDDAGEKKTAPLAAPLSSKFKIAGPAISAGTKIKAEGDLTGVITAAKSLMQKAKTAAKPDDKSKAAAAAPAAATGSQGAANDVAKNYQPLQAAAPTPAAAAPPPADPTLTLTSNGCTPRVDAQGGFVVIQSQTLSNGAPMSTGCTDTAERIPIQKSYTGCPDLISGSLAQPQFKQFWVATNGTTNFIGDCQPDPDTKYNITSDTSGCTAAANLTALTWDAYAQQVYLNHNNVKVVVSSCAVSTSTALQVGKDYKSCSAMVDLTSGIVSPEYKAWYVNPTTNQQQNYTTCQPDLAAATAIQKDYAACPAVVGATAAQRQYQVWYADTTGTRVNYGSCTTDLNSSMVIQTTSTGCTDYVDQGQMKAFVQVRSFYYDAGGVAQPVKDCAPDPAQSFALVNDYTACPAVVNQAAGFAEDVGQLYYMNATNTRVTFGSCTPDPNRLYVIKQDFSSCADQVDLANLKAYAQFQTYYLDVAGLKHPVNQQCQPQSDAFKILADTSVCTYAVDMSQHMAQEQGQLYYLDRLSARVMVRDCGPTTTPPIAVTPNVAACTLRTDFTAMLAIQQQAWQFTDQAGSVHKVTSCVDSTITYPITNIYGVCPDLVMSDKSAAFKQVRSQITTPGGTQYLTDCSPSQTTGDEVTPATTVSGCETTFFNYLDQGQSYGAWRWFYQFAGGSAVYITSCLQSTTVYPHQVEIQGYLYNDPQKTAQPKTDIYINTPVGRVDVSPAQVRAGAANVAYLYERTGNISRPSSMYWVSCEAYQPTDRMDTYQRPDLTEVSYLIGPGPVVDMGDQCARSPQSQTIYYDTVVSGPNGMLVCASSCIQLNPGTYFNLAGYSSCLIGPGGAPDGNVTNYNVTQTRTATTLPAGAGGTTSYSAWVNGAVSFAGGYSCAAPPANGPQ